MFKSYMATLAVFLLPGFSVLADEPTYWKDIRPIFRKHCTVCHKASKVADLDVSAGLALDSLEAIKQERDTPIYRAGEPEKSWLVTLLSSKNRKRRMPLDADPLSEEEIATVRNWVKLGGPAGEPQADATTTTPSANTIKVRQLPVIVPTKVVLAGSKSTLQMSLPIGPLPPITAVRFSPNGEQLAVATYGQVVLWDLTRAKPVRVLKSVLGAVNDLAYSPDGRLLAVAGGQPSARGDLRIFEAASGKLVHSLGGHQDTVSGLAFSPDGKLLASASFDKTVRLWDSTTAELRQTFTGHSDFVYAVAFAPHGKWLVTASKDRSSRLIDTATGQSQFTFGGTDLELLTVAVRPDGQQVVTSGADGRLQWWNPSTGERIRRDNGHGQPITELHFAAQEAILVTGSTDRTVRLWNSDKGSSLKVLQAETPIFSVDLSGAGTRVAAGGADGLVRVWDVPTSRLLATFVSSARDASDWIVTIPEGYFHSSASLLSRIHWLAIPAGQVSGLRNDWKDEEQVQSSLAGKEVPLPTLPKK